MPIKSVRIESFIDHMRFSSPCHWGRPFFAGPQGPTSLWFRPSDALAGLPPTRSSKSKETFGLF